MPGTIRALQHDDFNIEQLAAYTSDQKRLPDELQQHTVVSDSIRYQPIISRSRSPYPLISLERMNSPAGTPREGRFCDNFTYSRLAKLSARRIDTNWKIIRQFQCMSSANNTASRRCDLLTECNYSSSNVYEEYPSEFSTLHHFMSRYVFMKQLFKHIKFKG